MFAQVPKALKEAEVFAVNLGAGSVVGEGCPARVELRVLPKLSRKRRHGGATWIQTPGSSMSSLSGQFGKDPELHPSRTALSHHAPCS